MRGVVALLVLVIPAADVVADVALVSAFGWLGTLLYLAAAVVVGVVVLRAAGPITVVRATRDLEAGQVPTKAMLDGLLLLAGGLYFAFPGPVSDAVAVVLVTPFLRSVPRALVLRTFRARKPAEGPVEVRDYRIE